MIKEAIYQMLNKEDLSFDKARIVMDEIMSGEATNAQISAFVTALRMKGESIEEITGCASSMRGNGVKLNHLNDVLEIVGTGGDEAYTLNISTVTSIDISAAGVPVAKHFNRSVSSKCGAADVLEALGVKIDIPVEKSEKILDEIGLCFMFAPIYHSSMRYAAPVRKEIGVRTIFNILGPLSSPAAANYQLLGVYKEDLIEPLAKVLANLGVKKAMVVNGNDGLDEITLSGTTKVCEYKNGEFRNYVLDPKEYGFEYCKNEDLVGGDPEKNAEIARSIFRGEKGPKRDVIVLNSAICLYLADAVMTISDGVNLATEIIDSGKAMEQLEKFVKLSNE